MDKTLEERVDELEKFNSYVDIHIFNILKESISKLKNKKKHVSDIITKFHFHTDFQPNIHFQLNNNQIKCTDNLGILKLGESRKRNEAVHLKMINCEKDFQLGIGYSDNIYSLFTPNVWCVTSNGHIWDDGKYKLNKFIPWENGDNILMIYKYYENQLEFYKNTEKIAIIDNLPIFSDYSFYLGSYKDNILEVVQNE